MPELGFECNNPDSKSKLLTLTLNYLQDLESQSQDFSLDEKAAITEYCIKELNYKMIQEKELDNTVYNTVVKTIDSRARTA